MKRPEKRKFCSGKNQDKQIYYKLNLFFFLEKESITRVGHSRNDLVDFFFSEKESITRVGHSRNGLVDFFGRGLGSKKIHIIQQMYKETWNKNEILAWSYTTLTQTIIQIQMTSYPSLGTLADYTLSVKRV